MRRTEDFTGTRGRTSLLALALLVTGVAVAAAQSAAPPVAAVMLGPGSQLWLEGTSTIHAYESRTSTLGFTLRRDAAQADPADAAALDAWLRAGGLRGLELVVPVGTMRSGKAALDKNMFKALRTEQFPEIRFQLDSSQLGTARGDTLPVSADGALRVSGKERPITVKGQLVRTEKGVWLEGSHAMRMSEYDVKPPKMMLGTLKVHDPIVVRFRLLLVPGDAGGPKSATHQ